MNVDIETWDKFLITFSNLSIYGLLFTILLYNSLMELLTSFIITFWAFILYQEKSRVWAAA